MLKADSIYRTSSGYEHKYYVRNKIFLGINYNVADDTIKSLRYLKDAETLAIKISDQKMLADAQQNIATVYLNSGFVEKAEAYAIEAISNAEASNNLEILGYGNITLSRIERSKKKWKSAIKKVGKAKEVFEQLGDFRNVYLIEYTYGEIYMELGEPENAIPRLSSAIEIGNKSNHFFQHGIIFMQLARIFQTIDTKKSIYYFEKAFENSSVLNGKEFSILINTLSSHYTKTKNLDKQNRLIEDLTNFYRIKSDEIKVELLESNQREIEIQKKISEKKILELKNESNKTRFRVIIFASIICIMLALYALFQLLNNKRLTKKISEQNNQLQNQNTELKNFASIASHDLKAPVRSISSFASLIERLLPDQTDPKILNYLGIIKTSSANMNSLVNSLLEFSTIENRDIEITSIPTAQFIEEVLNNLYSLIETKKAVIVVSENLPSSFKGDATLLKIVFQNIINNALKFVADGVTPSIKIDYTNSINEHSFQISDNGIGIEKEYLEKIFLIFERLHSSKDYEGSGIGLATCKKIMLLHKGDIDLKSKPNQGTTFTLTIPKSL